MIAAGAGAKRALSLAIEAGRYGVPISDRREAECAIVGRAAMAQTATGRHHDLEAAARALVRTAVEVRPDPAQPALVRRPRPSGRADTATRST